ncbi:Modulator of FtsH protease HflC [Planctomycetes bacterium Pla163]|uniref:Modulator of FtsH protease HflC n=1 Tax=Rohdeia mirabilis TaxID=2528008 RepID=A0A518CX14_9BACT|nr:Modulator of FtsH protease HflC [Planctomycetes bacterium Pla163]
MRRTGRGTRQDGDAVKGDGPTGDSETDALLRRVSSWLASAGAWIWAETLHFARENPFVTAAAVAGLVRACGTTVDSGQTGLLFSFGRVKKRLDPGFHLMIPFLQRARIVPTRSRTLELENQRIVTEEGLVYVVRANLVWRIEDIEKALIEVDDVVEGMRQLLAISVQEVLRGVARDQLRNVRALDGELEACMSAPLEVWGVAVERAGFQSISPSRRSIRVTQLRERVTARHQAYEALLDAGLEPAACIGLVGTRHMPRRRALRASRRDRMARRTRAVTTLRRRVWNELEAAHTPEAVKEKKKAEKEAQRKAWLSGESVSPSASD